MKNWNTDVGAFKSAKEKKIWQLVQMIEYGADGEKISSLELKNFWPQIKHQIDPINRRLYEFWLWGKISLPTTKKSWWQASRLTTIYQTNSI